MNQSTNSLNGDSNQPTDAVAMQTTEPVTAPRKRLQFRISTLLISFVFISLITFYVTQRYQAERNLAAVDDRINAFLANEIKPLIEAHRSSPSDKKIGSGRSSHNYIGGLLHPGTASHIASFVFVQNGLRDEHVYFGTQIKAATLAKTTSVSILVPSGSASPTAPNPAINDQIVEKLKEVIQADFDLTVKVVPVRASDFKPLDDPPWLEV